MEDESIRKIVEEVVKALKEEEIKKKSEENKRKEYTEKIRRYFPGVKEELLEKKSVEDLERILKYLNDAAKSLEYTPPPLKKERLPLSFTKAIRENFIVMIMLFGALGAAAMAYILR